MSTDVVKQQSSVMASSQIMGEADFDRVWRMAKAFAASGMFKDVTQAEQAFGRIMIGQDLGLSPTQALQVIHVVRGNVQVAGKQLLSWIRASENYDYELVERTPERGAIQFYEKSKRTGEWSKVGPLWKSDQPEGPDNPRQPIAFTLAEAKAKGLWAKNGGWDNWPENMCLWRCASIGFNLFCPDLSGGTPIYTEADSFVDGSAVEIGQGEGTGEAPGWDGLPDETVAEIEALIVVENEMGPAQLDLATVQMRLNGRPEAALGWITEQKDALSRQAKGVGETP